MSASDETPEVEVVEGEDVQEDLMEEEERIDLPDSEDAFDLVTDILRRAAGTEDVGLVTGYFVIVETHDPETGRWSIELVQPGCTPRWRDEALLREATERYTRNSGIPLIVFDGDDDDDDDYDEDDEEDDTE